MYHAQLTDKIMNINSIKEKIDPLKNSIASSRKELSLYLDRLKDLQLTKDEHKVSQKHSDAREKLQKNARLTLEDLKLLIERGDVKFSNECYTREIQEAGEKNQFWGKLVSKNQFPRKSVSEENRF